MFQREGEEGGSYLHANRCGGTLAMLPGFHRCPSAGVLLERPQSLPPGITLAPGSLPHAGNKHTHTQTCHARDHQAYVFPDGEVDERCDKRRKDLMGRWSVRNRLSFTIITGDGPRVSRKEGVVGYRHLGRSKEELHV